MIDFLKTVMLIFFNLNMGEEIGLYRATDDKDHLIHFFIWFVVEILVMCILALFS